MLRELLGFGRVRTARHDQIFSMTTVQERAERLDRSKFFGVPIAGFERAGRQQFILLVMAGLEPKSMVLDLGCGVLRAGYWLIQFLDPGCYYGIEPNRERIETGRRFILEPDIERVKQPRFDTNPEFDSGVFGVKFDFFLAYSIWTHASKPQIETMLDNFLRHSKPAGVFLTSILPADWARRDYRGKGWFGTSHESDQPGCIRHSLKWIRSECRRRGLRMRSLGRERDGQTWLQISRDSRNRLLFRTIWSDWAVVRLIRRLFEPMT
jgi:SAM-dependent methyltransferase